MAKARFLLGPWPGQQLLLAQLGDGGASVTVEVAAALPSSGPPYWRPIAAPVVEHSSGALVSGDDGLIYFFGGTTPTGNLSTVERYDPASDSWGAVAPMPAPNQALWFSTQTQQYVALPPLPTRRAYTRAVAVPDGRLLVIGGDNLAGTADLPTVEAFDPVQQTWRGRAPLLKGCGNEAVALGLNGKVYVFGGDNITTPGSGVAFDTLQSLDVATDTWQFLHLMPVAASGLHADTGLDGRLYAQTGTLVLAYAPGRDSWETVVSPGRPHDQLVRGSDGRLYSFGGGGDAYGPIAALSVSVARPSEPLFLSGENFAVGAAVSVSSDSLSGAVLGEGVSDGDGGVSALRLSAPAVVGLHQLFVVDDSSGFPIQLALRVEGEPFSTEAPLSAKGYRVLGCASVEGPPVWIAVAIALARLVTLAG